MVKIRRRMEKRLERQNTKENFVKSEKTISNDRTQKEKEASQNEKEEKLVYENLLSNKAAAPHLNNLSLRKTEVLDINDRLKLPYEGKQLFTRWSHSYPNLNEIKSKTFYIKYDQELSVISKMMLNNFQNKYFYNIIDDITDSSQLKPVERDKLLSILYPPVLYLQNHFSIDFFDIWIDEIYIHHDSKVNKFLEKNISKLEPFSYLTIKFLYTTRLPVKKPQPLW